MRYITKERVAFWVDQTLLFTITAASIWFASRIGYQAAVNFTRYEELRKSRDILASLDQELACNDESLEVAFDDWTAESFRYVHVSRGAYRKAAESDQLFSLRKETIAAVEEAYDPDFDRAVAELQDLNRFGEVLVGPAQQLAYARERIAVARERLREEIALIEAQIRPFDAAFPSYVPPPRRATKAADPTPDEQSIAARPASPGWTPSRMPPYLGPVSALWPRSLTIPARPRGPLVLSWRVSLPQDRTAVRLWICLFDSCPVSPPRPLSAKGDAEELQALLVPSAWTLCHPLPGTPGPMEGTIIDPNRPVGWKWAIAIVEDEMGDRFIVDRLFANASGGDDQRRFLSKPDDRALVLPIGYLRGVPVQEPEEPAAYLRRGDAELAAGRPRRALGEYSTAIALQPSSAEGWLRRATARLRVGQSTAAIEDLDRAAALEPKNGAVYRLRADARRATARAYDAMNADGTPMDRKALEDYDRVLYLDEADAGARLRRGLTRIRLGEWEAAKDDLQRAAELDASLATTLRWIDRFAEDQPLRGDPVPASSADALLRQMLQAYEAQQYEAAAKGWKRIFYSHPRTRAGRVSAVNSAFAYAMAKDPARALDWLEIAVEFGFDDWILILSDPDFQSIRGDARFARLAGNKAEELGPRVRRAIRRGEDRDFVNAGVEKGIALSEREANAQMQAALQIHTSGDYATAIAGFKRVYYGCNLRWIVPRAAYNIACGYAKSGDRERALDWIEIAIADGYKDLEKMKADEDFASLQEDPRFRRLTSGP